MVVCKQAPIYLCDLYGIYFRIAGDEIRILVMKHHSQHPDYGMGRV